MDLTLLRWFASAWMGTIPIWIGSILALHLTTHNYPNYSMIFCIISRFRQLKWYQAIAFIRLLLDTFAQLFGTRKTLSKFDPKDELSLMKSIKDQTIASFISEIKTFTMVHIKAKRLYRSNAIPWNHFCETLICNSLRFHQNLKHCSKAQWVSGYSSLSFLRILY